jgi:hypothetical protein
VTLDWRTDGNREPLLATRSRNVGQKMGQDVSQCGKEEILIQQHKKVRRKVGAGLDWLFSPMASQGKQQWTCK